MRNFILSKKDAVIAGGCFLSRMSMGLGDETQSRLLLQAGFEQHSGSSQSDRPSANVHKFKKCRENYFHINSIVT